MLGLEVQGLELKLEGVWPSYGALAIGLRAYLRVHSPTT